MHFPIFFNKRRKVTVVVAVGFFIIIILWFGYFLPQEQWQKFKVINTDIHPQRLEEYRQRFESSVTILQDDPTNYDALLELGNIKRIIGDIDGAEKSLLKALEVNPESTSAYSSLAVLYADSFGDYQKANEMHQKLIEKSVGDPSNILFYRGYYEFIKFYIQDEDRAIEILKQGINQNLGDVNLLFLLGQHFEEQGQHEQALVYYQQALERTPQDEVIINKIQEIESGLNKFSN